MNFKKFYSLNEEGGCLNDHPSLLLEGGAYGRILHPYDDDSISFKQVKDIIAKALTNQLESVYEKTDGINVMVTWKDGKLRLARNKSHIKNCGEGSLSIDAVSEFFGQKHKAKKVIIEALRDLETLLKRSTRSFKNGKRFLSVEVINTSTRNVIPYSSNMIIPHCIREYNRLGQVVNEDREISQLFKGSGKKYKVVFSEAIQWTQSENTQDKVAWFHTELQSILDNYNLNESNTIKDYKQLSHEDPCSFKTLMLKVGTETLKTANNLLVGDIDESIRYIVASVNSKVENIQKYGTEENKEKLRREFLSFQNAGGYDSIAPTEGIIFEYNGKMMKLVGNFTHVNQILNIGKYRR